MASGVAPCVFIGAFLLGCVIAAAEDLFRRHRPRFLKDPSREQ